MLFASGSSPRSRATVARVRRFCDRREDGLFACFEFGEFVQLLLDGPDLQFVERTGRLLAVAADKGDRRAVAQQAYRALHLPEGDSESLCYDLFGHCRCVSIGKDRKLS